MSRARSGHAACRTGAREVTLSRGRGGSDSGRWGGWWNAVHPSPSHFAMPLLIWLGGFATDRLGQDKFLAWSVVVAPPQFASLRVSIKRQCRRLRHIIVAQVDWCPTYLGPPPGFCYFSPSAPCGIPGPLARYPVTRVISNATTVLLPLCTSSNNHCQLFLIPADSFGTTTRTIQQDHLEHTTLATPCLANNTKH